MKKLLTIIIVLFLIFSTTACANGNVSSEVGTESTKAASMYEKLESKPWPSSWPNNVPKMDCKVMSSSGDIGSKSCIVVRFMCENQDSLNAYVKKLLDSRFEQTSNSSNSAGGTYKFESEYYGLSLELSFEKPAYTGELILREMEESSSDNDK